MIQLRLIIESFRFAWNALRTNLLRTILSLLSVTIGVFTIITVLTLVDSLEKNMKDSFSFLGAGVIYVEKWPFVGGPDFAWWDYMKRPDSSFEEFKFLEDKSKLNSAICIFAIKGGSTVKYQNNSLGGTNLFGVSEGYSDIFDLALEQGRYFKSSEVEGANNLALIGINISNALFPQGNPVGSEIKIRGAKFRVIGLIKEEGESFIGTPSNDDKVIVPYESFRKIYATGGRFGIGSRIGLKGLEGDEGLKELEGEVRGLMRQRRGLRPKEDDNFEINRPEAIADLIGGVFDVLSIVGWVVGGLSILVGGFAIANIMFVSVKERTNIIGIQKSLGAKNYFILLQFIFEAIFLSVLGGVAGLLLVSLVTFIPLGSLEVILSLKNISIGVGISVIIGVLSGLIPAVIASQMDPVVAIRTQ